MCSETLLGGWRGGGRAWRLPESSEGSPSPPPPALPSHHPHHPHHPHHLGLNFLPPGPPLAALHSMTEMRSGSPPGGSQHAANSGLAGHAAPSPNNPHGIDTILSRPALGPRGLSLAAAAANVAQYFQHQAKQGQMDALAQRGLYWPGFQGLLTNPLAWRDRLSTMSANALGVSSHSDKDGKKKHTRPTFSGQQIFALEKTFEQTKYLAGPERAKLAYALGMTESQVKVWFQNRRTKWRKKHAAEMATAKRKQEELGEECEEPPMDDDDCRSDPEDDNAAKRLRRELQHHRP